MTETFNVDEIETSDIELNGSNMDAVMFTVIRTNDWDRTRQELQRLEKNYMSAVDGRRAFRRKYMRLRQQTQHASRRTA